MISPRAGDVRNAALCGLATLVALVVVWPISGLSFNDDWSFAFTAKRLAETGHVLYNGWSSPSVIGQSYYALPWVRLFGFSFNVLRLSTAPLAIASVVLTYVLARRAGLDAGGATFAAAALLACPLFLPLATSFMTDVPGLFCILASTYALVRCRAARTGTALAWLAVGVAVAAVGGSSRQIVWVAPLAVLPYVAWLRRADRGLAVTFVLAWASTFAAAAAIQRWFNAQPFALPEPSITSELARAARRPVPVVLRFLAVLLTTLLLLLPAMAVVARRRPAAAGRAASAAGVVAFAVVMIHPIRTAAPWTGNILTPRRHLHRRTARRARSDRPVPPRPGGAHGRRRRLRRPAHRELRPRRVGRPGPGLAGRHQLLFSGRRPSARPVPPCSWSAAVTSRCC